MDVIGISNPIESSRLFEKSRNAVARPSAARRAAQEIKRYSAVLVTDSIFAASRAM